MRGRHGNRKPDQKKRADCQNGATDLNQGRGPPRITVDTPTIGATTATTDSAPTRGIGIHIHGYPSYYQDR